MKQHTGSKIILLLCGLFLAPSAVSHPYNSPLTFRKHTTDDGRVIYSNIPKSCFSNDLLLCQILHPVLGGSLPEHSVEETKPAK